MAQLGERIKDLRKERGIAQQKLAEIISVSKSMINRYENKGVQPPADVLNKIAGALDTSVDFLINGNKDEKAMATLKSAELLKQFKQVEDLPDDEQSTVIKFVGAYLRDFRAKQAYAST